MKKRSLKRLILIAIVGFISLTGMKCVPTSLNSTTVVSGQHIDYPQVSGTDLLCDDSDGWLCPGWHPPQDWYWEYQEYYVRDWLQGFHKVGEGWVGGPCGSVFKGCDPGSVPGTYGFD